MKLVIDIDKKDYEFIKSVRRIMKNSDTFQRIATELIKAVQVAEVSEEIEERPQGEWITRHKLNSFGQDVVCFECNKCGEYKVPLYHLLITEPLKVCPNCGADMMKGGAE